MVSKEQNIYGFKYYEQVFRKSLVVSILSRERLTSDPTKDVLSNPSDDYGVWSNSPGEMTIIIPEEHQFLIHHGSKLAVSILRLLDRKMTKPCCRRQ